MFVIVFLLLIKTSKNPSHRYTLGQPLRKVRLPHTDSETDYERLVRKLLPGSCLRTISHPPEYLVQVCLFGKQTNN